MRRLGAQVSSIRHAGVDVFVDIDRIRPFSEFRTIFDVGAHVGESAIEFCNRAPLARVIAIEPVRANYDKLSKNVAGIDRVVTVNAALSSSEGQATMSYGASSQTHSLAAGDSTAIGLTAGESVRMTTVDKLAEEYHFERIDFLKTDTEGHDLKVLSGAARLLSEKKIDFVFSEVTFLNDGLHTSFFEMHDLLSASGFTLMGLYDIAIARKPGRIEYCNALFTRV